MKQTCRILLLFFLFLAALFLFSGQLALFGEWENRWDYRLSGDGVPDGRARELIGSAGGDAVFWTEDDQVTVSVSGPVKRSASVHVLSVCGNPQLLFGASTVPQYGDTRGCLLDAETAWELFGSSGAEGETVTVNGREYTIRGILEQPAATMVIQTPADAKESYDRLAASSARLAEQLLSSLGQTNANRLDWQLIRLLTPMLLIIAGSLFFICLFPRRGLALAGTGALLFLLALLIRPQIPAEYIPGSWSDFTFYAKLWADKTAALERLLCAGLNRPELLWLKNSAAVCLFGLTAEAALFSFVRAFGRLRRPAGRGRT